MEQEYALLEAITLHGVQHMGAALPFSRRLWKWLWRIKESRDRGNILPKPRQPFFVNSGKLSEKMRSKIVSH